MAGGHEPFRGAIARRYIVGRRGRRNLHIIAGARRTGNVAAHLVDAAKGDVPSPHRRPAPEGGVAAQGCCVGVVKAAVLDNVALRGLHRDGSYMDFREGPMSLRLPMHSSHSPGWARYWVD
jgi:hypothetical protein